MEDERFTQESYDAYNKLRIPENSINLSTREDELDFDSTIIHMMDKSEDGTVKAPIEQWSKLLVRLKYSVSQYIFSN